MPGGDSAKQIKQMVNFIYQEANEKVNEIKIKTEHDFTLEKQTLHNEGTKKVDEEYRLKEKDLLTQQKVSQSKAISGVRVKKMKARDDLLETLKKDCTEKLAAFVKTPQYSNVLRQLIVQGLIKIEEQNVEIQCRAEDKAIVTRVLPEAMSEYRKVMSDAGYTVNPKVSVSDTVLSKQTTGGLILSALHGRIVCNQTLDERLEIAYTDMLPSVRYGLFPM